MTYAHTYSRGRKEDLADVCGNLSGVRELAWRKQVSSREAGQMVLAAFGGEDALRALVAHHATGEDRSYHLCRLIIAKGNELAEGLFVPARPSVDFMATG